MKYLFALSLLTFFKNTTVYFYCHLLLDHGVQRVIFSVPLCSIANSFNASLGSRRRGSVEANKLPGSIRYKNVGACAEVDKSHVIMCSKYNHLWRGVSSTQSTITPCHSILWLAVRSWTDLYFTDSFFDPPQTSGLKTRITLLAAMCSYHRATPTNRQIASQTRPFPLSYTPSGPVLSHSVQISVANLCEAQTLY